MKRSKLPNIISKFYNEVVAWFGKLIEVIWSINALEYNNL